MAMLTIEVPDEAIPHRFASPEEFAKALRFAAAAFWYSRTEVSHGTAARIAGMTRVEFIDALARARVDAFQVDIDDLKRELERARIEHSQHVSAGVSGEGRVAGGVAGNSE